MSFRDIIIRRPISSAPSKNVRAEANDKLITCYFAAFCKQESVLKGRFFVVLRHLLNVTTYVYELTAPLMGVSRHRYATCPSLNNVLRSLLHLPSSLNIGKSPLKTLYPSVYALYPPLDVTYPLLNATIPYLDNVLSNVNILLRSLDMTSTSLKSSGTHDI